MVRFLRNESTYAAYLRILSNEELVEEMGKTSSEDCEQYGWVRDCHSHGFDFWRIDDGPPDETHHWLASCMGTWPWRPVYASLDGGRDQALKLTTNKIDSTIEESKEQTNE